MGIKFSFSNPKPLLITGHFGSGKTNVAVNLAMELQKQGKAVTLLDFDIVNPYFRAADSAQKLEKMGISCILPEFANSNVDIPTLPSQVYSVFLQKEKYPIFDVGGDDTGATALGVYNRFFKENGGDYEMFYVINQYRLLTDNPVDTVNLMRDIEQRSRLRCTAIINNSNIGKETHLEDIQSSFAYAEEVCKQTGLPLAFHSIMPEFLQPQEVDSLANQNIFLMENVTKNIYE